MYDNITRLKCALKRVGLYVLLPQVPTMLAEFELFFPELKGAFAIFGLIVSGLIKGLQKDKSLPHKHKKK